MTPAEYIDFDAVMPYSCPDNDTGYTEEMKDMPPDIPTDIAEDMPADTIRNTSEVQAGDAPEVSEEHTIDETPEPKKRRYFCSIS